MRVRFLTDCRLRLVDRNWGFAISRATAIRQHWVAARRKNPQLFDGDVFVTERWRMDGDAFLGEAVATTFSSYLFWRDHGFDGGESCEAFATTVIVAADGGILLARAAAGSLNEGLYVSPGGLLDRRDVGDDGYIDIAGAAARELAEETGIDPSSMRRERGFLLVEVSPFFGVASVYRADASGPELLAHVVDHLSKQLVTELVEPQLVYRAADLDQMEVAEFTRLLTKAILA